MIVSGWGNYPKSESSVFSFRDEAQLKEFNSSLDNFITRGNGRSYGDSALSQDIISSTRFNYFINFDEIRGLLRVQSGVLLSEIIEAFLPRGWFLKVTPGTKLITVGGAIASDVHGKNHHIAGCFSECVESFTLLLPDNTILKCSRSENIELFRATCGGMGLTGVILEAEIYLKKVTSNRIQQTTIKTQNLEDTFEAFEEYKEHPYSVAWIDCLAKSDALGRCLLTVGDFAEDHCYDYKDKNKIEVPFNFPSFSLNKLSVQAFNFLYYQKVRSNISQQRVSVDSFFYPLDAVGHWNKIYGKQGFVQYQFILPKASSFEGLKIILEEIAKSGMGSFLAVLKLYGAENDNFLSFPMEGYSLALDFKIQTGLFELLEKLDKIVVEFGGRIYLAKDARMSKEVFEKGYPMLSQFKAIREKYNLTDKLKSMQSERLGI